MLLARHELSTLKSNAESVARIARESRDESELARALELAGDIDNELRCRAAESDDVPF